MEEGNAVKTTNFRWEPPLLPMLLLLLPRLLWISEGRWGWMMVQAWERAVFGAIMPPSLSLSLSDSLGPNERARQDAFFVECRLEWWWTSNLVHELRQEFVGLRFSDFFFSFCTFLDAGRTFLVVFDVSESNSSPSSSLFGKRGKEATFRLIVAAITAMHSLVLSRPLPPHSAPAIRRFLGRRR